MSIKAIKDNAKFISKVYTQEASDTDWAKAKPKVKFKYKEANVLDSSTTSELVINKSISEGDIVVVNDNGIKKKILKDSDISIKGLIDKVDPFGDNSGVALYQLDGNANDTGGRYNGTWHGNEAYDTGKFGQGAKTTKGDGNIILGKNIFKDGDKISVSLWVNYLEDEDDNAATFTKYNYKDGHTYKNRFLFGRADGKNSIFNGNNYNRKYGSKLDLNKFYHLVFVVDENETRVYLNGELDFTINKTTKFEDDFNVRLGYTDYRGYSSNQIIDQVRIFNRPLADEEVQRIYAEEASKFNVSDLNLSQTPQKIWIIDGSMITPKDSSTTAQLVLPANSVKAFDTLLVNDGIEKEIIVRSVEKDADGNDVVQLGQELALVPSEVAKVDVPEVIIDIEPTEQELLVDDIELEKESSTKTQFVGVLTKNIPISAGMEVILDNKAVVTSDVNIENMSIVDKVDPFGDNSGVALWKLDGSANDAGGNHNGTWHGTEAYKTGKFGQCADLSGDNDYITTALSFSNNIQALSFWAYIIEPHGDNTLFAQDGSDSSASYIAFSVSEKFSVAKNNKDSFKCTRPQYGEWAHIIVQDNGSEISVYFNGIKQSNEVTDYNSIYGLQISNWGYYPNNPSSHSAHCYLDQVRVFNRALTEEEVQKLYKYELKYRYTLMFPKQPQDPRTCLIPAKGKRVKLTPLQISYDENSTALLKEAQEFEKTGRFLQYAIKSPKDIEINQLNIDLWKDQ